MPTSELEVCCSRGISHVTRMRATYPYKFLRSNVSNSAYSTIFLLGYGGGAVSGDRQELQIIVNENAVLILRTQGSTKIFKCVDGKYSSQKIVAHLSNGSLLAFLPDPTTCFSGSKYDQHQIFNLEEEASLVLCDWYTSGRMCRGESWLLETLNTTLEIFIAGKKVFFEKLDLHDTADIATAADKVGNASVFGCVVLVGPYATFIRARISAIMQRQTYRQVRESHVTPERQQNAQENDMNQGQHRISIVKPDDPLVSVSNLGEKISVLRFAADSTEDAYKLLAEVLKPLAAGKLSGMQKPYADRIHSLVGQDFRQSRKDKLVTIDSDVIIKSGEKRRIDVVNDNITSNVSSPAKNPNLDPNDRMLGSAIRAMRKYDEMLLIDNRPILVPG